MTAIGIVHWDLMKKGGAESVSVNLIEKLQQEHRVTLITTNDPDICVLNEYYDADLSEIPVRGPQFLQSITDLISRVSQTITGYKFDILMESLLLRYAQTIESEYDVMISTHDECCFSGPSVQYINFPRYGVLSAYGGAGIPEVDREHDSVFRSLYYTICLSLAGFSPDDMRSSRMLTNSEWTADIVRDLYNCEPKVVYPPVAVGGFESVPWDKREDGFVTIGRLSPDKRVVRNIRIVKRLNERGHNVHLHIVGPDGNSRYAAEVASQASQYDFVHLEGALRRDDLEKLIMSHKYGIHGKEYEHFGMTVAELMAGGAIPFVHNSGGQTSIVDHSGLVYSSVDEATEKIERVLSSPDLQREMQPDRERIKQRFGRERFKTEVADVVSETLQ